MSASEIERAAAIVALTARLNAELDEDEATAKAAAACDLVQQDGYAPGDWSWLRSYGQPQPNQIPLINHQSRFDPARELREVKAKRDLIAAILAEPHHRWPGVSACRSAAFPGEECTCGRDARVERLLRIMAQAYEGEA